MVDSNYRAPGIVHRKLLNPLLGKLAGRGVLPGGTVVLVVPGRVSGRLRTVPLTPFAGAGGRFLISPRGETDWVRNLRAAGGHAALRAGTTERIRATELSHDAAVPVLQSYLRELGGMAKVFFDDLTPDSSAAEIAAVAHRYPVFVLAGDGAAQ
ncbi:deazaflavin-dependent nitroreductase [Pseudonocardia sp. NPDC046786]|uniref:deazaflavin-dependent nitroreductase n=1 Tax=Pseudonocardia sp. NPDC046786 TaxID=3155471 RepID=UPI0033C2CBCD